MSLFDYMPGRRRPKAKLPRETEPEVSSDVAEQPNIDLEAPAETVAVVDGTSATYAEVQQPVSAPAEDAPVVDTDSVEPVAFPERASDAESGAPVHEKVEGIDDIADVVVPAAADETPAARRGFFKRKPKKPIEPPQPTVAEPAYEEPVRQLPERRRVAILAGFRDPVRRPRYILWTGAAVLGLAAVMIVALGVTSTRWFCSEACHKVQDDTITAYQHSSHSEISCMACHMPVGASPVVFILHKAEALGELYLTVTNNYELPLNGESEVALTMKSTQCTQCHDVNKRKVTPAAGLKIDHKAHEEKGVECAVCHNRIAHNEDFELALNDPKSGKPNKKHENFMAMTACFRCHTQNADGPGPLKAPGECIACHPAGYEKKKPPSHLEAGFFPEGHGELGQEAASKAASASAEAASETAEAEGHGGEELGASLPKVETINECSTCHSDKFCSDCHGNVIMPHPADFKRDHGKIGKANPKSCAKCHGPADRFCDDCHHNTSLNRKFDTTRTWIDQHPAAVRDVGASKCLECHNPIYCARCHTQGTASE